MENLRVLFALHVFQLFLSAQLEGAANRSWPMREYATEVAKVNRRITITTCRLDIYVLFQEHVGASRSVNMTFRGVDGVSAHQFHAK